MSEHAALAPSAADRWIHCPGSVALNRDLPRSDSPASREGTFAHSVADVCLREDLPARSQIGLSDGEFTVDAEMAEHLQTYLDAVREIPRVTPIRAESKVRIKPLACMGPIYGTADAIVHSVDDVLHVFDLKFGAGVFVDVHENAQLKVYALCVLDTFSAEYSEVPTIDLHIVQPRHHQGGHSVFSLTRAELLSWGRDVLFPAAVAAGREDAEICPGDWCRWCDAKPFCPALRAKTLAVARDVFTDDTMSTPSKTPPSPADLTPEVLSSALQAFPVIEQWIKAVREYAQEAALAGKCPEGYKLVRPIGNRRWKDPSTAEATLELFGFEPHKAAPLVSPADVEKQAKMSSSQDLASELLAKLTERPIKGPMLVPETDKRQAFTPSAVFPTE